MSKIDLIKNPGEAWEECERALDDAHTSLPLFHRVAWARAITPSGVRPSFIAIREETGRCRAGFALESHRSRALPGHRQLSIARFGAGAGGMDAAALDAGLGAVAELARRDRSVLRVIVEAFGLDMDARDVTANALRHHGFEQVPASRIYERTLLLDLSPAEDTLLASFHRNARQRIRNSSRLPVAVKIADSVSLAPRLKELDDATRTRTGGGARQIDWESFIRMSAAAPRLSRIAILERTDRIGADAVIAFAWGCMHRDVAQYSESGSIRPTDLNVPTSYALLWDLILWARNNGARLFDLGGVTSGHTESDDPLGGISDFKRSFSRTEVEVGQQWQLLPHPGRAALAGMIGRTAATLGRVARTALRR